MKKTLVLCYPNLRWAKTDNLTTWNLNPSTLCLLGAVVVDEVNVHIVDGQFYDLSIEQFVEKIFSFSPDLVGISVLSSEYEDSLAAAARAIKDVNPAIPIITGGVYVTQAYRKVIENPHIDYVVRGEGEYVLRDLVRYLCGRGRRPETGLVYKNEKGEVVVGAHMLVGDLTRLPAPDYSLVDMAEYARCAYTYRPGGNNPPLMPGVRLSVTRGCPVGCSFCQVKNISGKKIRTRDVSQVVDEMIQLRDRYAVKSFIFDDDNLVGAKAYFKKLLRNMIARNVHLKFVVGAFSLFAIDDEMLDLMARADCVGINVAIETGSQRVMDEVIKKPLQLSGVSGWIRKIKDKGLFVIANFMIGFPGESWREIRTTIQFAEDCGADYVKFFIVTPLKGTRLWRIAEEKGVLRHRPPAGSPGSGQWHLRSGHGTDQIISDEWDTSELSILRAYEWDRINFTEPERSRRVAKIWGISRDKLEDIRLRTRRSALQGLR